MLRWRKNLSGPSMLFGVAMAYVLVLQLVLGALSVASHAASRFDSGVPDQFALSCNASGKVAAQPTGKSSPVAMSDCCTAACNAAQTGAAVLPASAIPLLWLSAEPLNLRAQNWLPARVWPRGLSQPRAPPMLG
jgi:hypothetical protein